MRKRGGGRNPNKKWERRKGRAKRQHATTESGEILCVAEKNCRKKGKEQKKGRKRVVKSIALELH